jgi:peptidoglycan hydrolase CwlO-like protein
MIGAPDLVAKFGGKFIPIKKPAAAQPAAAGGLPAVQAQAPAAAQAESRTIPSEAEGLYKQLGAIEAEEEKMSSSEKQNRIKQINKEIESLQKSATQKYSGFGLPGAGKLKTGSKERRDIERDILRVEQLVAERNRLEGKTQTAKSQFNSQEDVIKAIKSRQLTREQGKTILQNQFGLQ